MVYKCCVTGSRGNFDSEYKVKIFLLPQKKYSEERQKWLKAIPMNNILDAPNMFICEDHWPKGYESFYLRFYLFTDLMLVFSLTKQSIF